MRQFVSARMPDSQGRIPLSDKENRYLVRVLRLRSGDSIDVRLSDGTLVAMNLCIAGKDVYLALPAGMRADTGTYTGIRQCSTDEQLCIATEESAHAKALPCASGDFALWLFQFLPKAHKMDLIVRQAAECGVFKIVPVISEYSPPSSAKGRAERWKRIVREARQQSGSAVATEVTEPLKAEQALALWNGADGEQSCTDAGTYSSASGRTCAAFMLSEKPAQKTGESGSVFFHIGAAARAKKSGSVNVHSAALFSRIALAVGCEGGISPAERTLFEQNGFMPIHLKTNILRSETAALYGLAAIQNAVTEYGVWMLKE